MILSLPSKRIDDADLSDCQSESLGCMVADHTDHPALSSTTLSISPSTTVTAAAHPTKGLTTEAIVGILGIVGILLIAVVASFAIICGCGCRCARHGGGRNSSRRRAPVRRELRINRKADTDALVLPTKHAPASATKHSVEDATTVDDEKSEVKVDMYSSPKLSTWDPRTVKLTHGLLG